MTTIKAFDIPVSAPQLAEAMLDHSSTKPRLAGIEMERFLLTLDGELPTPEQHDAFYIDLKRLLGESASVETGSHAIEIKTEPESDPVSLSADLARKIEVLKHVAFRHDLIIQQSSDLPGYMTRQLAANVISRIDPVTHAVRRAYELCRAYERSGLNHVSAYSCTTTSLQFTHSVPDADQLHRFYRIHAAMMPLYYAIFENRTRVNGVHTAMAARRELGSQGLIPSYVFEAADGHDFVRKYVDNVLNRRMVTALSPDGQDFTLERPTRFTDLPEDQRTLGNLLQAASFAWNVCKIRPVLDEQALAQGDIALTHLLLEARDMDVSEKAIPAIAGWFFALTESEETLTAAEEFLEYLGIPVRSAPLQAGDMANTALRRIENRQEYLNLPYGDMGLALRDMVGQLILPILNDSGDPANAAPLWKEAAASAAPYFRVQPQALPALSTPFTAQDIRLSA